MITRRLISLPLRSDQERADAQQKAEQISLDISNVISDLSSFDDLMETIVRPLKILLSLRTGFRNRSDALSGWKLLLWLLLISFSGQRAISWHQSITSETQVVPALYSETF